MIAVAREEVRAIAIRSPVVEITLNSSAVGGANESRARESPLRRRASIIASTVSLGGGGGAAAQVGMRGVGAVETSASQTPGQGGTSLDGEWQCPVVAG